jgi:TonB family protein
MIRLVWLVGVLIVACAHPNPPGSEAKPGPASGGEQTVSKTDPKLKGGLYYKQLNDKVFAAWKPADTWKALPEARRSALGTETRETVVRFQVSTDGALTMLVVDTSSGVSELDAEAMRAFQGSSPFGAPPDGTELRPVKLTFRFEVKSGASTTLVIL